MSQETNEAAVVAEPVAAKPVGRPKVYGQYINLFVQVANYTNDGTGANVNRACKILRATEGPDAELRASFGQIEPLVTLNSPTLRDYLTLDAGVPLRGRGRPKLPKPPVVAEPVAAEPVIEAEPVAAEPVIEAEPVAAEPKPKKAKKAKKAKAVAEPVLADAEPVAEPVLE